LPVDVVVGHMRGAPLGQALTACGAISVRRRGD
jgi:hypothetical protein